MVTTLTRTVARGNRATPGRGNKAVDNASYTRGRTKHAEKTSAQILEEEYETGRRQLMELLMSTGLSRPQHLHAPRLNQEDIYRP